MAQRLEILAAYVPDGSGHLARDLEAETSVAQWLQRCQVHCPRDGRPVVAWIFRGVNSHGRAKRSRVLH